MDCKNDIYCCQAHHRRALVDGPLLLLLSIFMADEYGGIRCQLQNVAEPHATSFMDLNQGKWYILVGPVLGMLWQVECEFEVSLGTASPY